MSLYCHLTFAVSRDPGSLKLPFTSNPKHHILEDAWVAGFMDLAGSISLRVGGSRESRELLDYSIAGN